jgi:hypothetical protein
MPEVETLLLVVTIHKPSPRSYGRQPRTQTHSQISNAQACTTRKHKHIRTTCHIAALVAPEGDGTAQPVANIQEGEERHAEHQQEQAGDSEYSHGKMLAGPAPEEAALSSGP